MSDRKTKRSARAYRLRSKSRSLASKARTAEAKGKGVKAAAARAASKVVGAAANIADPTKTPTGKTKKRKLGRPTAAAGAVVYEHGGKVERARLKAASKLRAKGKEKAANIMNPYKTPKGDIKKKHEDKFVKTSGFKEGGSLPGRRAAASVLRKLADKKVKKAVKLKGEGKDVRAAMKMDRAAKLRRTASDMERKARPKPPKTKRLRRPRV